MKKGKLSTKIDTIHRKHFSFVDRIGFGGIFVFWLGFVILSGLAYFFFSSNHAYLIYIIDGTLVNSLIDSVYFSVIAATTTGFGDIVPMGLFKLLASIEVIVSLLVVAAVTSKFISLKQDVILEELYEITFAEKINRMRSSLMDFRHDVHTLIHKVEDKELKERDTKQMFIIIATFKETIKEINSLFTKQQKDFLRQINSIDVTLITNSMVHSFQRLNALLKILIEEKYEWKHYKVIFFLEKALEAQTTYFKLLKKSGLMPKLEYDTFYEEITKTIDEIEDYVKK